MSLKAATLILLTSITTSAHASFFDFFKADEGSADEVQETATQTEAVKPAVAGTTDAMPRLDLMNGLVPDLMSSLSITESQATGGLGSVMQYATNALSSEQNQQLSAQVPGLETLLAAAPALGAQSGLSSALGQIGALGGSIGDAAQAMGGLDAITQQFEALGLSPDMIAQIAQMAMQYFSSNAPATGSMLQDALGALIQ